jgi:ABC-2 type transport system permease protein
MSQLFALVWLKWTLVRNSLRSRKAVAGRVASALGMLAGLGLSLTVAVGVGAGSYMLSAHTRAGAVEARQLNAGFAVLLFLFTLVFVMWALMPLALGGGSRFEPARMLLYPVSLGKLFAFDFLSDLTSLTSIFVVPSLFALCLGVGLGRGNVAAGLAVALAAVAFGLSLSKLLSVAVGALIQARRTRGETVVALLGSALGLLGVAFGMTGGLMGKLLPLLERHPAFLESARWTPPGAAANALARGLFTGDASALGLSLLTLAAYTAACVLLAYRVARRTALGTGGGGGGARRAAHGASSAGAAAAAPEAGYAGWQLPFASPQFSALFEKEVRYALRNAQLRVIALMAVALTMLLRIGPMGTGSRWMGGGLTTPYAEGAGTVFGVIYIFMLVAPVSTNLFGYDGAGMRSLVLSPASRRTILLAKNAAMTLISLLLAAAGVCVGGLISGDLSSPVMLFALLSFVTTAALFAPFGNWLSLQFPKRMQFGKSMSRSGVGGLLLLPLFVLLLVPPAVSIAAAYFAGSHAVKYVILAAFALLSIGLYVLVLPRQGRQLERRELEVLEAVTGRGGGEDEQIIG